MWLRNLVLVVTLSFSLGAWAEMPLPAAPAIPAGTPGTPPPSFASVPGAAAPGAYPGYPAVNNPQVTAAQMEQLRNACSLDQNSGPTVSRGGRYGGLGTH